MKSLTQVIKEAKSDKFQGFDRNTPITYKELCSKEFRTYYEKMYYWLNADYSSKAFDVVASFPKRYRYYDMFRSLLQNHLHETLDQIVKAQDLINIVRNLAKICKLRISKSGVENVIECLVYAYDVIEAQ